VTGVGLPSLRLALRVWRRDQRVFARAWRGSLLPQFLDPVFYLLALGLGLGAYVHSVGGVPYRDFIAPGLCGSAVMWAASFETTWNSYYKLEEIRLYDAIISTPVEVPDLVLAEMLWAATRAVIYGTVFGVVISVFGLVHSAWFVLLPPFLVLGGLCFAALGLGFTSLVKRPDLYTYYFTLFITPTFLFGGIFYPYDRLPGWAQTVAWFTPLYHLVGISRGLASAPDAVAIAIHALWLAAVTAAVFLIPVRQMTRRLVP
jgi:lipooligosaccharide transport system permease protein